MTDSPGTREDHDAMLSSLRDAFTEGGISEAEVAGVVAGMVASLLAISLVLRETQGVMAGQCFFTSKTGQTIGLILTRRPGGVDIRVVRIADQTGSEEGHGKYPN